MGLNTSWTPERLELLEALWADGVPAGDIAKRLGGGITRGMVAGKRFKLGLPPRTGRIGKAAMAANARRTAAIQHGRTMTPFGSLTGVTADAATAEAKAERRAACLSALARDEAAMQPLRGSNPKPWELRGRRECAFPVAGCGSMVLSCCEPIQGRGPYCHAHHELASGRAYPVDEPANAAELLALAQAG